MGLSYVGGVDAVSPKKLKGEYAFTGTVGCLTATGGFDANLQPLVGSTFISSLSVEGVRVFNPDGTGTATATFVTIGLGGASSGMWSQSFTYTVNSDDTFVVQLAGPLTGTILTGVRTGQTLSFDFPPLTGLISKDGNTLTLAHVVPTVETLTFSNGDVQPRICHRSHVLVKMDKD
jgi:hypothetical protein